jgi:hypothetical protein
MSYEEVVNFLPRDHFYKQGMSSPAPRDPFFKADAIITRT